MALALKRTVVVLVLAVFGIAAAFAYLQARPKPLTITVQAYDEETREPINTSLTVMRPAHVYPTSSSVFGSGGVRWAGHTNRNSEFVVSSQSYHEKRFFTTKREWRGDVFLQKQPSEAKRQPTSSRGGQ